MKIRVMRLIFFMAVLTMTIHVTGQGQVLDDVITLFGKNKKEKGYFNVTQVSLLMGNRQTTEWNTYYYPHGYPYWSSSSIAYPYGNYRARNDLQIAPSVTITNGYRFNEHWAAGVGIGFEIFNNNLFPVFADIRYTLWDSKVSPFFALKTGYAFNSFKRIHYDSKYLDFEPYYVYNADIRVYGGFMLNPEIGVKVTLSEKTDLLFIVAYRHQKIKTVVTQTYDHLVQYEGPSYDEWEHNESLNRLSFGLAILFR